MTRLLKVGVLLSGREQFSPYFGGALARWTYEVYSRLRDRIDVRVAGYPTAEKDLYNLPFRTHRVWRLCNLISPVPVLRRWDEPLWLRCIFRSLHDCDTLHIHNRPQWAGELRKIGFRGAIVVHLQNNHLGHWATEQLDLLASQLDAVVVCSSYLGGTFAGRSRAIAAKTKVIFNGVDIRLFYPREDRRKAKTIFFVGRFDQEKGILQLVQAYGRLLAKHPDAELVIAGTTGFGVHRETNYVKQVRKLSETLMREKGAHIRFPGYIHHDKDLPGWFQQATIFACPSLFAEPFGLVNAEAMACRTPVVGSNRGGIPEVLGDAGIVIDPENIDAFSAALAELLESFDRRAALADRALERCKQRFDWDIIATQWAGALHE